MKEITTDRICGICGGREFLPYVAKDGRSRPYCRECNKRNSKTRADARRAAKGIPKRIPPIVSNPRQFAKRAWDRANPVKRRAQKCVEVALNNRLLTRLPCERCGAEKAHAHHDDYSWPLDVMWLCPTHHKERHRELAAAQLVAA